MQGGSAANSAMSGHATTANEPATDGNPGHRASSDPALVGGHGALSPPGHSALLAPGVAATPQVPLLPESICSPADQWKAVMLCAQYPALRRHLYGLVHPPQRAAAYSGYSDACPVPRQAPTMEMILTQLAADIGQIKDKIDVISTSLTEVRATAEENANIVLRLADLTSEYTRLINVFNLFVYYVILNQAGLSVSDTTDDLFQLEVKAVDPLLPHLGDKDLVYNAMDNVGQVVPMATWPTLPYALDFPDSRKLTKTLFYQYRSAVQRYCIEVQAAARANEGEPNPDILMTGVDMSKVEFVRVIYNTKDQVVDIVWPAFPIVEGPHNEPVPRAHRGEVRHPRTLTELPPPPTLPSTLTRSLHLPGSTEARPPAAAAPSRDEELKRLAGDVQVSQQGLGRESGNKGIGVSESDSALLRRMGELQDQVAAQKRALDVMFAKQDEPRKRHNTDLVRNSIDTIMALSVLDQGQQPSTVLYPQAHVPMEKWTGKETDKIRNGATWIRGAIRNAMRSHIPLVEFLEGACEGPGQAWSDGLSRAYSLYVLQQTQLQSGEILIMNGQAMQQGKPVTLIPALTAEYITTNFHQTFLHNKSNAVEDHMVSLYGGCIVQSPKESLCDYILRFKSKVWDANLVLEANPHQMISLLYTGLLPYLKHYGCKAKKGNAIFETFFMYEEFLTEKDASATRLRECGIASPGLPIRHVAPVFHDRDFDLVDYDCSEEEDDYYTRGMINAVRPQTRPSNLKAKNRVSPTSPQVIIPGPPGKSSITVRKRDVAFFLNFADDSADWPLNGTPFSEALKDPDAPGPRPKYKEQVLLLMKYLRPTISDAVVGGIFDTAKAHNRDWVWCILHGSTAHHTHLCPCLQKAFPPKGADHHHAKVRFKNQQYAAYLAAHPNSGEESD